MLVVILLIVELWQSYEIKKVCVRPKLVDDRQQIVYCFCSTKATSIYTYIYMYSYSYSYWCLLSGNTIWFYFYLPVHEVVVGAGIRPNETSQQLRITRVYYFFFPFNTHLGIFTVGLGLSLFFLFFLFMSHYSNGTRTIDMVSYSFHCFFFASDEIVALLQWSQELSSLFWLFFLCQWCDFDDDE